MDYFYVRRKYGRDLSNTVPVLCRHTPSEGLARPLQTSAPSVSRINCFRINSECEHAKIQRCRTKAAVIIQMVLVPRPSISLIYLLFYWSNRALFCAEAYNEIIMVLILYTALNEARCNKQQEYRAYRCILIGIIVSLKIITGSRAHKTNLSGQNNTL
jgi:hypothetical protein